MSAKIPRCIPDAIDIIPADNGGWVVHEKPFMDGYIPHVLAAVSNDEDLRAFISQWLIERAELQAERATP